VDRVQETYKAVQALYPPAEIELAPATPDGCCQSVEGGAPFAEVESRIAVVGPTICRNARTTFLTSTSS
jgi:hypothetical protein